MDDPAPRVFVADDEPALRGLIREVLESEGFEVTTFPTGDELLGHLDEAIPDLVLLDINMPGMDGWQVRRRLLEDPRTQHVPVVAVTARGGTSVEASARRSLAFSDLVRKPFKIGDLLEAARGALQSRTGSPPTESP